MTDDPAGSEGTPDYETSYANERTYLAWNRTALALGAVGAAILKLFPPVASTGARTLVGFVALVMAAVVWLAGYARYRTGRSVVEDRSVATARVLRPFSIGVSVVTAAALVLSLLYNRP